MNPAPPRPRRVTPALVEDVFAELQMAGYAPPPLLARSPDFVTAAARMWAEDLVDITAEELLRAVRAWRRGTNPFWPKPGQLRALVPRVAELSADRSDEAWGLLVQLLSTRGHRELLRLEAQAQPWTDDPSMDRRMKAAAQAAGGVKELGTHEAFHDAADRAAFVRAYRAITEREAKAQTGLWPELPGQAQPAPRAIEQRRPEGPQRVGALIGPPKGWGA